MPRHVSRRDDDAPHSENNDWFAETGKIDFKKRMREVFENNLEQRLSEPRSDQTRKYIELGCAMLAFGFIILCVCLMIALGISIVRLT